MAESKTKKKLKLSVSVDETVDLFIGIIKMIMISLTHHHEQSDEQVLQISHRESPIRQAV
jgi:hypothetical protein